MANTIKLLFWLHRSKMNKEGQTPLILRLTFQKRRLDKATGYYVSPEQWNTSKQRMKGNKDQAKIVNERIEFYLNKFSNLYREEIEEANIHLPSIMDMLFATAEEEPTLLRLMTEHIEELKLRVNKDFAFSTYEKYVFTFDKVKAFIESKHKKKDILLRDITTKFVMDFDQYLRVNDNNQHNTAVKYCINLKRILNVAVLKGMMVSNPLNAYKTVYKDTAQVYLSEAELNAIENTSVKKNSYLLVKDLFLFQCCTGLAYTDMINLEIKDISVDSLGRSWIIKKRQKTGVVSTIPLLPKALDIIEKYKYETKESNQLFPHYSIQKYNQYIGEIGELAGLHKKLSSHVGRRTFGNIALARGVSLNVISKVLGHSNTLITQRIYAITTQNIISKEIEKW